MTGGIDFGGTEGTSGIGGCGFANVVGIAGTVAFFSGIGNTDFSVGGIGPSTGFGRDAEMNGGAWIGSGIGGAGTIGVSDPFVLTLFPVGAGRKLKSGKAGGTGLTASADFAGCAGGAISAVGGSIGFNRSDLGKGSEGSAAGGLGSLSAGGIAGAGDDSDFGAGRYVIVGSATLPAGSTGADAGGFDETGLKSGITTESELDLGGSG